MSNRTVGERLSSLKTRAEMSLAQIAEAAGYRGASSIQKFFNWDYDPENLNLGTAKKLGKALVGRGNPPIEEEEVLALTGTATNMQIIRAELASTAADKSRYIVISNVSRLEDSFIDELGNSVPLFRLVAEGSVFYIICPDHLVRSKVLGIYVPRGNMIPRFEVGELVFYEATIPPRIGEDVVVNLRSNNPNEKMFIARLTAISEEFYEFYQFSPPTALKVDTEIVDRVARVLTRADLTGMIHVRR